MYWFRLLLALGILMGEWTSGAYAQEVAFHWSQRVELVTTGVGPVVEDISMLGARSAVLMADRPLAGSTQGPFAVLGGTPVAFETSDLDGDGKLDELLFISEYHGAYHLYFTTDEHQSEPAPPEVTVVRTRADSWAPRATAEAGRPSGHLTPRTPMTVIRTRSHEFWVGEHSGLIECVRDPQRPWHGSVFREWAPDRPNLPPSGSLKVTEAGAVRVCLRHYGATVRDIEVWADGTVFTTGLPAAQPQYLLACVEPYSALQMSGRSERFSDCIASPRALADTTGTLKLAGEPGGTLRCTLTGGIFAKRTVRMADDGLIAEMASGEPSPEAALSAITEAFRTVIPAGMWVVDVQPTSAEDVRINYSFSRRSEDGQYVTMQRATVGTAEACEQEGDVAPGQASAPPSISIKRLSPDVPNLQPNRGYGWRLKPFVRALENPLPAYFQVTVQNALDSDLAVLVGVEAADWLDRADLVTNYQRWNDTDGTLHSAYTHRERMKLDANRYTAQLQLPPKAAGRFLLALYPVDGADGVCATSARVITFGSAVEMPLEFSVIANIPVIARDPGMLGYSRALRLLGFNTIYETGFLAHDDIGNWVTPEGKLTDRAVYEAKGTEIERRAEFEGLFVLQRLWLDNLASAQGAKPGELERFLTNFLNQYRPWERWTIGYTGFEGASATTEMGAAVHDAFRAASVVPLTHLFDSAGLSPDAVEKTPCDVPAARCPASDEGLHRSADLLTSSHRRTFAKWIADPGLSAVIPVGQSARPQYSLVLSAESGATDYTTMRRQAWWAREHDLLEGGLCWSSVVGTPSAGDQAVVPCLVRTSDASRFIPTGRALALRDIHEDMAALTRLRTGKAQLAVATRGPLRDTVQRIRQLEERAATMAQEGRFSDARRLIDEALDLISLTLHPRDS